MLNKRGQGLSTNAIILIILGVIILVILALGFMMGWDKFAPWISSNNVDTIVTACETACTTSSDYGFCLIGRDLKAGDVKLKEVTCYYLSEKKPEYGIEKCDGISCDVEIVAVDDEDAVETDFGSEEAFTESTTVCTGHEGKTIQALIDNTLVSRSCEASA